MHTLFGARPRSSLGGTVPGAIGVDPIWTVVQIRRVPFPSFARPGLSLGLLVCALSALGCGDDGSDNKRLGDSRDRDASDQQTDNNQVEGEKDPSKLPILPGRRDAGVDGGADGGPTDAATEAELDIPQDGLFLLLRADRGASVSASGVFTWSDQSGAKRDATQEVAALAPRLSSIAEGRVPAVVFDGLDDFLELPPGFIDFTNGLSIFAVAEFSSDAPCGAILEVSNGSEVNDIHFSRYERTFLYEVLDTYIQGGVIQNDETVQMSVIHRPNKQMEMRINGRNAGGAPVPLPQTIKRALNYVGKTLYATCGTLGGGIGTLLVYNRALSEAEVSKVEATLRSASKCCSD